MPSLYNITILTLTFLLTLSCQSNLEPNQPAPESTEKAKPTSQSDEEQTLITQVEKLLFAAGNYNIEDLDAMTSDNAMLAISSRKEGIWSTREITIGDYFSSIREEGRSPYSEIPTDYDFIITEGRLASVRADCISYRLGVPGYREINHLTLIKENDAWQFLNIAWTIYALPEEEQVFDLEFFARGYAQSWGSQRPNFVALYYTEDGALQVNDGDPAQGRDAIAEVAASFMTQFPDMRVSSDSLVHTDNGIEFHWTLTGTDADPDGKGNKVKISGFELWTMSADNLILNSKGHFDAEEYARQLEFGIAD